MKFKIFSENHISAFDVAKAQLAIMNALMHGDKITRRSDYVEGCTASILKAAACHDGIKGSTPVGLAFGLANDETWHNPSGAVPVVLYEAALKGMIKEELVNEKTVAGGTRYNLTDKGRTYYADLQEAERELSSKLNIGNFPETNFKISSPQK